MAVSRFIDDNHPDVEFDAMLPAELAGGDKGHYTLGQIAGAARTYAADTNSVTSDTTLGASDINKSIRVDASGGTVTITLPSTGLTSGRSWLFVYKADSSANTVVIRNAALATIATLTADEEGAELGYAASAWEVRYRGWGGILRTPAGSAAAPAIGIGAADDGIYSSGTGIAVAIDGAQVWRVGAGGAFQDIAGGGTINNTIRGEGTTQYTLERYSASSLGPVYVLRKARATIAGPGDAVSGDIVGTLAFQAYGGSAFRSAASVRAAVTEPAPGAAAMGARLEFLCSALGSVSPTEVARIDHATGLSMFGANPVIDQNRNHVLRSYTVAGVPSAATAGVMIYVSNESGGAVPAFSDGTNWRRVTDRAIIS